MFTAAKDAIAAKAAQSYVNQRIARYGEVRTLKLDSRAKTAEIVCVLHGEPQPVAVRIDEYVLLQRGEETFLRIRRCSANRLWLQNLLNDYADKKDIALPSWAASAL